MKKILLFTFCILSISKIYSQKEYESELQSLTISDGEEKQRVNISDENKWKNPDKNLIYYWYQRNQVFQTQGSFSGSLLNGDYKSFFRNHSLKSQGEFYFGLKDGTWLYWREDGTLLKQENWNKGEMIGQLIYYDQNGKDSLIYNYNNGELNGKYYHVINGKKSTEGKYKNGELFEDKIIASDTSSNVTTTDTLNLKKKRWFGKKEKQAKDSIP